VGIALSGPHFDVLLAGGVVGGLAFGVVYGVATWAGLGVAFVLLYTETYKVSLACVQLAIERRTPVHLMR
jgi:hypothetical protein